MKTLVSTLLAAAAVLSAGAAIAQAPAKTDAMNKDGTAMTMKDCNVYMEQAQKGTESKDEATLRKELACTIMMKNNRGAGG
jgi:formylmethanofuran dehydrogenase subunit B